MRKFEKGILISSIISLVLTMIFGFITGIVGMHSAVKYFASEGVKTVFDLMEYGTKKLDGFTENGRIVVNEDGEDQVIIDFSEGIHIETGTDTVSIDRNGIVVNTAD